MVWYKQTVKGINKSDQHIYSFSMFSIPEIVFVVFVFVCALNIFVLVIVTVIVTAQAGSGGQPSFACPAGPGLSRLAGGWPLFDCDERPAPMRRLQKRSEWSEGGQGRMYIRGMGGPDFV